MIGVGGDSRFGYPLEIALGVVELVGGSVNGCHTGPGLD